MKTMSPILEEAIRIEAYLLSEKAGHPSGMDATFWTQAESLVLGRTVPAAVRTEAPAATAAPAAKLPPKKKVGFEKAATTAKPAKAVKK